MLLVTFEFDYEYEFHYEYDFSGTTKLLISSGSHSLQDGSNLVAVLFITRIAEDLVVTITSSKAKKSYS